MKHIRNSLLAAYVMCLVATVAVSSQQSVHAPWQEPFLVKPYLQLGDRPALKAKESLTLIWQAADTDDKWKVEVKTPSDPDWRPCPQVQFKRVAVPLVPPHRIYSATLEDLVPGRSFAYRVLKDDSVVFISEGVARKSADMPFRFVAFGDLGVGSPSQRKVAYQIHKARPDLAILAGDLVYRHGRLSEYRSRYFPVYNADEASPDIGAPLIRSTLFVAAPGNHDIGTTGSEKVRNLDLFPDGMAYFYLWSQPLNGFVSANNYPVILGAQAYQESFLEATGRSFPRMANFSFDYSNAHFLILDGNDYMDWSTRSLRSWVAKDLASAQDKAWRFVCFHQSPFSSDSAHFEEQRMRLLADVFAQWKVDVVFTGHMHNYQRTYPMRYQPAPMPDGKPMNPLGMVPGSIEIDKTFDGKSNTQPTGIIYIVTGAGGAPLSGRKRAADLAQWQPYTDKFLAHVHSFTICDVTDRSLTVRQISEDGSLLDQFMVSKP